MRRKILIRGGIGFLLGDVMVLLIPALFNRTADGMVRLCSNQLLARVGSAPAAILTSLLLYGLYGACCMGGTLLYEIERWPMALATAGLYGRAARGTL